VAGRDRAEEPVLGSEARGSGHRRRRGGPAHGSGHRRDLWGRSPPADPLHRHLARRGLRGAAGRAQHARGILVGGALGSRPDPGDPRGHVGGPDPVRPSQPDDEPWGAALVRDRLRLRRAGRAGVALQGNDARTGGDGYRRAGREQPGRRGRGPRARAGTALDDLRAHLRPHQHREHGLVRSFRRARGRPRDEGHGELPPGGSEGLAGRRARRPTWRRT
jgi:hypothetical protein